MANLHSILSSRPSISSLFESLRTISSIHVVICYLLRAAEKLRAEVTMGSHTPTQDIPTIVKTVDANFTSDKTRPIEWRKRQLKQLYRLLEVSFRLGPGKGFSSPLPPLVYTFTNYYVLLTLCRKMKPIRGKLCFSILESSR